MLFTVCDKGYAIWNSAYNRLKKAVWSLSDKDHCFRFLKTSRCFGNNWQDLSEKKKINCFNIKSEVIIIYSTYEPILNPLMHILQKLLYTLETRETIFITFKYHVTAQIIKLPWRQLLAVFTAICHSHCLIKAMPHGKMLYHEMRALWCARDSVFNSLKKAVWRLSDKASSFRFLKISRCFW
jgi:hypothetical protein